MINPLQGLIDAIDNAMGCKEDPIDTLFKNLIEDNQQPQQHTPRPEHHLHFLLCHMTVNTIAAIYWDAYMQTCNLKKHTTEYEQALELRISVRDYAIHYMNKQLFEDWCITLNKLGEQEQLRLNGMDY